MSLVIPPLLVATALAAGPAVVLRGAAVFDPASGTLQPDRTIVIQGETISAVGTPERPAAVPPDARVLDGRGRFVLPGLIDAHVHLVHRLNFAHVTGDEVLPLFLAHGVTSVRDTGDEIYGQTMVARHADAHPALCPRVFRCSGLLDGDPPVHRDIGIAVTNPGQVAGLVDDMAAWGVTTLKIYVGTSPPFGRKIIEEGHKRGMHVTGHLADYPAPEAVADGIDCLEHITTVFDFVIPPEVKKQKGHRATVDLGNPRAKALLKVLARRQVFVDPTLVVYRNMLLLSDLEEYHNHPDVARVPRRQRDYWHQYRRGQGLAASTRDYRRQVLKKYQELTGMLHRAGVPLLAGTDANEPFTPAGSSLLQELELLVESGLPPAAALRAATLTNARALGQADRLGSVEAGKRADLVVLTADPLADIKNTRKIEYVIHGGIVCDPRKVLEAVPRH
jgi:imidazolonepropionase-like amidohydrolase